MDLDPNGKQTIEFSLVGFLNMMNDKIDTLDTKVDRLIVQHAQLPTTFVSQEKLNEQRAEARDAKRWAISALLTSVGLVITGLFLVL